MGGGGTFREFTPSAGVDHGALLDDNPLDNGTTYVESQTVGHRETVKFANITPTSGAVYGIRVLPALLKTTFADRVIAPAVLSGGVLTVGTDRAPAQTDYAYYGQMFGGNPTTGVAWTIAGANGMEAGLKVTG